MNYCCRVGPEWDERTKAAGKQTLFRIGEKDACAQRLLTKQGKRSPALNCNTSTMRIERNVNTEKHTTGEGALKLPKTVCTEYRLQLHHPFIFFF